MKKQAVIILFLGLIFAFTACRTHESSSMSGLSVNEPGRQDVIFLQEALAAGAEEMQIGELGMRRAQNLDLRLLAQRIFDDHARAQNDLAMIARQNNIAPMTEPPGAESLQELENASGTEFDSLYLHHLSEKHWENIKKFESATRHAKSQDVRELAARILPVLREHQRIAQNIEKTAALDLEINEAAGAQRSSPKRSLSPFYQGGSQRSHQFDQRRE